MPSWHVMFKIGADVRGGLVHKHTVNSLLKFWRVVPGETVNVNKSTKMTLNLNS